MFKDSQKSQIPDVRPAATGTPGCFHGDDGRTEMSFLKDANITSLSRYRSLNSDGQNQKGIGEKWHIQEINGCILNIDIL